MPTIKQLEQYADVLIRIGLNIQPGQPLTIRTPIEAAEFVRILTARAYAAGASTVNIDWSDPIIKQIRLKQESEENLQRIPNWVVQKGEEECDNNTAFLTIAAEDPDLLADVDPKKIALYSKAHGAAMKKFMQNFMEDRVSWLVCSIPTAKWATKMFPGDSEEVAVQKMWDAIFDVMRMNEDDPVAAWNAHLDSLEARAKFLNDHHFQRLHYKGPGTDLKVALPKRHFWQAARSVNAQNDWFVANLPTEEVFTLPQRDGVDGVVKSTMPLAYGGVVIEELALTFEHGRIIDYTAKTGYETLKELIETDEGSHFLGEIALVPVDSPISNRNQLFYNTLFDENASCHIAIGKAYPTCLVGGKDMSEEEQYANGANDSITHVDFMIGSAELDIDGETADGSIIPLFRKGNWVI
ncbi:aminopeptidase [Alicyclobacillus acidoterrestris]|uniref:Aminopeptidase n=1 Tax=Alicyclobacillus acidoterrestris (strain ATCC 49025 / DSM 3922 / CIP 106132 / NCIMB 13137 / GD3B) TaxID=1356854 RepID=T0BEA6_ALIAG|nr:aminopeptidase [Alicyclobacillus acidoterrestris]EPZ42353.1 hypothetical protein N007_15045 [Alicyclobacillus acidoterrestris ATCC 49025]UNO50483.1 aminopeptidase [Alicyclobacillus acidoterrestris]